MSFRRPRVARFARQPLRFWRWIGLATIIGILLAFAGPFGTYLYESPESRLGYWIAATLAGLAAYGAAFTTATLKAPPGTRAHWPLLAGATLLASVPQALLTRTAAFRLWPDLAGHGPSWAEWYGNTVLIGSIAALGYSVFLRRRTGSPAALAAPVEPWPREVLALQMEDHYVRVHTARGSELMLMPLGRAIESAGNDGIQVHRSWWVARQAVEAIEGTPRSMRIRLTNGLVAPVARSAVARLRAAGWI